MIWRTVKKERIYILNFIIGRAGSGKTSEIRKLILKNIKAGNDKIILLVPEQNSFDTEKNILNILGEQDFEKVEVLSFTRLCDFVFRKVGQKRKKRIDDGGRSMFMSMAIEAVKSELNLYKKNSNNMEIVELMINTFKEFKMFKINGIVLSDTLEKLSEGTLKEKIRETKLILDTYIKLLSDKFSDPLEDLDILEKSLSDNNIFKGYTVFLDSFNGFTLQQINVLKYIMLQSSDVYITFCSGNDLNKDVDDINIFSSVDKSIRLVKKLAEECGVNDIGITKLNSCKRFESFELKALENGLFNTNTAKYLNEAPNVLLFNAVNIYDECNFIAREIKSNIMNFGYRYKDFAIIGRNICNYSEVMENIFRKYDIKYFFDEPEPISNKSLMSLVFSAFEIVHSNYSFNEIFRYLKTGLVGFSTDDISIIENYVMLWDIKGKKWKSDFTYNPNGFGAVIDDKAEELLNTINKIRSKIIAPLVNFEGRIKNNTGQEIAKAVYMLLEEVNVANNIRDFCTSLKHEGKISEAQEQARLWDILMEALNQTAIVIGKDEITSKRYMELLGVVIESGDISFIPQGLDEVTIGSVDRIRLSEPKITFVIGAVEGEFPRTPVQAGIFSDAERRKLISMGLNLYDTLDKISIHERFLTYFALTSPSKKLYVSWPSSNTSGTGKMPSEIIREIKKIFPKTNVVDKYSMNEIDNFWSEKTSFEICARNWNSNSEMISTLKYYFKDKKEYRPQINAIERLVQNKSLDFENPENAKELFGDKIRVSASQIEKYYLCRFYYFCKYGLKAKERKAAKFNAMEYGSLIHFILEDILSKYSIEQLGKLENHEIKNIVGESMDRYVIQRLGGIEDKPPRFKYLYLRCADTASILIKRMVDEFTQSKFIPCDYEAEISKYGLIKPLRLKLPNGGLVEVEGKIDRIDVMESDGKSYVRIIDYKTGTKVFKLSDVLYGLNMQMMVYMTAICNNGYKSYSNIIPAGILYMPAVKPVVSADAEDDDKKLEFKLYKKLCMNGLILDNVEVVEGMEKSTKGIFIHATIKDGEVKKTDSIASLAQIGTIMKYVEKLIVKMAESLRQGKVSSSPVVGEYNSCEWCPYGCICGHEDEAQSKTVNKYSKDKTLEKMEKEEK